MSSPVAELPGLRAGVNGPSAATTAAEYKPMCQESWSVATHPLVMAVGRPRLELAALLRM